MSDGAVIQHGSDCLRLVTLATNSLIVDPEKAQQALVKISQQTPLLLQQLEKLQAEHAAKRDDLNEEDKSLKQKIQIEEDKKNRLQQDIRRLNENKAGNEALLQDAKHSLNAAENQKRKAEDEKDRAVARTVGGGVGAVVLGIFFPPSLAVTVPAVAAAGTISISDANKNIDRCNDRIRRIEQDIAREKQQIQLTENSVHQAEGQISSLNHQQKVLYDELGSIRRSFVFLQKAVTFFNDMQVAVAKGGQETDLLHKIVQKANETQQYKILNSKGVEVVANCFAEAWEVVEDKLLYGYQDGYLGIINIEGITD